MKIKKLVQIAIAITSLAFGAAANAGMILTLDDGAGHSVTITDGGTGDLDANAGAIAWTGSLGNWLFNFTAGLSNSPAIGEPAMLDLASLNATSRRGGNLTITLLETGLLYPSGSNLTAITSVGGTTSGTVSFQSLVNSSTLGSFGPFSGAFSGTTSGQVDTTGGFTLTQIATIHHEGSGVTGFNMITTVPEPATLGLLGIGLIGLAFMRKRNAGFSK